MTTNVNKNRLKIRTHPPLGPFQAWIPFKLEDSIQSLRLNIFNLLHKSLSIPNINSGDILLELDGFAFLDQSPCSLIDPSHDLIDVKVSAPESSESRVKSSKKRPRSQSNHELDPKESHKLSIPTPNQKSDTQSIHDTAHSSKPKPRTSDRPVKRLPDSHTTLNPIIQPARKPPAPPGQGKPATKARNQRKRLKKIRTRELNNLKQNHSDQKTTLTPNGNPSLVGKSQVSHLPQINKGPGSHSVTQSGCEHKARPDDSTSSSESQSESSSSISQSESSSSKSQSESSSSESLSDSPSRCNSNSSSSASESNSSSASSPFHSSESESESDTSSCKSSLSALSCESPKTSGPLKCPASILQKTVPIAKNPLLNMLSLSNKNKRKNVKRKLSPNPYPSKIVFESPPSKTYQRLDSPCFVPPSPNCNTHLEISPELQQTNSTQIVENDIDDQTLVHNEDTYENGNESLLTITSAYPIHGAPPSVRHPRLVPSNIIISSVNVLNPYWTPGQIGKQKKQVTANKKSNNKTRRKNRKKGLKKRRRMVAKSTMLDNGEMNNINDDDEMNSYESYGEEEEEEEEILNEVEEAYQEFIKSGGHSRSTDEVNSLSENVNHVNGTQGAISNQAFQKNLDENWDRFSKIDNQSSVAGSKIAIRTWEISTESFTPELVIYHGEIIDSNEVKLTMRLDAECMPKSRTSEFQSEQRHEYQEKNNVHAGGEEDDDDEREERQIDVKEAIRQSHRNALINHLWGHPSPDVRNWDWTNILDAIKL